MSKLVTKFHQSKFANQPLLESKTRKQELLLSGNNVKQGHSSFCRHQYCLLKDRNLYYLKNIQGLKNQQSLPATSHPAKSNFGKKNHKLQYEHIKIPVQKKNCRFKLHLITEASITIHDVKTRCH